MKCTRTDHSGLPRRNLPAVPKLDLVLFHWSPTMNRDSINHSGLMPGKRSLQHGWRPPYVAFADEPYLAWALSGNMWPDVAEWDLWQFNFEYQTSFIQGYEIITDTFRDTGRHFIKEYRIYSRVYKRDLRYIATRTQ